MKKCSKNDHNTHMFALVGKNNTLVVIVCRLQTLYRCLRLGLWWRWRWWWWWRRWWWWWWRERWQSQWLQWGKKSGELQLWSCSWSGNGGGSGCCHWLKTQSFRLRFLLLLLWLRPWHCWFDCCSFCNMLDGKRVHHPLHTSSWQRKTIRRSLQTWHEKYQSLLPRNCAQLTTMKKNRKWELS